MKWAMWIFVNRAEKISGSQFCLKKVSSWYQICLSLLILIAWFPIENIQLFCHSYVIFWLQGPKHFNFIPKTFLIPHEYSEFAATHHRMRGQSFSFYSFISYFPTLKIKLNIVNVILHNMHIIKKVFFNIQSKMMPIKVKGYLLFDIIEIIPLPSRKMFH